MYDLKLWHLAALPTKKNPFRFIARINSRGKTMRFGSGSALFRLSCIREPVAGRNKKIPYLCIAIRKRFVPTFVCFPTLGTFSLNPDPHGNQRFAFRRIAN
jgi:hypothetical protein